jgi:hypothetical protein
MAEVRAHAMEALERIRTLDSRRSAERTYNGLLRRDIERFLERPGSPIPSPVVPAPAAPPGSPIGEPALDWLGAYPELCAWDWRPEF